MHAILFGIKRSFHSSVLVLRDFLRPFDLTPARYDLLFIVRERGLLWMSEVRRILGVTAATVSRMVKSLVERGIVTVTRPPKDKRQREIRLTAKGDECMRGALTLRQLGAVDFFVDSIFGPPAEERDEHMTAFLRGLGKVREACGDTSTDPDPWDPFDWDDEHITYEGLQELEDVEPDDVGATPPRSAAAPPVAACPG